MQDEGLPVFIALFASTVLVIGVIVAAAILAVVFLIEIPPEAAEAVDTVVNGAH